MMYREILGYKKSTEKEIWLWRYWIKIILLIIQSRKELSYADY